MDIFDRFIAVANLFAKKKQQEEFLYKDFLTFYENLVRNTPTEAIQAFGRMTVDVYVGKETKAYRIELSPTDFMWWKHEIENKGVRFVDGPIDAMASIMNRMTKKTENLSMTIEERRELLDILQQTYPSTK